MNKNFNLFFFTYLTVLCIHPFKASAQLFEAGMFLGAANYIGDLADPNFFITESGLTYGGLVRYNMTPKWTARLSAIKGTIQGNDANTQNKPRGFSFLTDVSEVSGTLEWNMFGASAFTSNGIFANRFDPYVFAGLALTSFTANAKAPAKTTPYPFPEAGQKDATLSFPIGLGLKMHLSEELNFGLEYGNRFTLSDYLDGISKTANPKSKDWYMFFGVTLSYIIGNDPYTYKR
jgi:OmpA-OmpF porin, OOP family